MRMLPRWAFVGCLFAATAGIACGGTVVGETGSGGSGAASATSSGDTTTSTSSGAVDACPPTPPAPGSDCAPQGRSCEYGDDPRVYCRERYECGGFEQPQVWVTYPTPDCPPLGGACPPEPNATGECTEQDGLVCVYAGGAQCACSSCLGGPCGQIPYWTCSPGPAPGCPEEAPNTGQACGSEGLVCDYGSCSGGTVAKRVCEGGLWLNVDVPCPV
jgi:hypothetical protein